jgi:predicted SprT family Zn-dependent metalloprotease
MRVKDRRRRYVFGVDLHRLSEQIWDALGIDMPMPTVQWWMTSNPRPHGLAWPDRQLIRISIPWHRPHLVLMAELILHEMCHCVLSSEVEDHGIEFQAMLTTTAKDLWKVDPHPLHKFIGGRNDPEYTLDRQIEASLMLAYYFGELLFEGDSGELPEFCRVCDTVYAGPTRCCEKPTAPL